MQVREASATTTTTTMTMAMAVVAVLKRDFLFDTRPYAARWRR
jgi:hypothetical protein